MHVRLSSALSQEHEASQLLVLVPSGHLASYADTDVCSRGGSGSSGSLAAEPLLLPLSCEVEQVSVCSRFLHSHL